MSKIYTVLEVRVLNKTNKLSNKNVSKFVKSKQHAGVAIVRTFGGLLRPIYLVVSSSLTRIDRGFSPFIASKILVLHLKSLK